MVYFSGSGYVLSSASLSALSRTLPTLPSDFKGAAVAEDIAMGVCMANLDARYNVAASSTSDEIQSESFLGERARFDVELVHCRRVAFLSTKKCFLSSVNLSFDVWS